MAGFPCTPYSTLGDRACLSDPNARQLFGCVKRIKTTRPKVSQLNTACKRWAVQECKTSARVTMWQWEVEKPRCVCLRMSWDSSLLQTKYGTLSNWTARGALVPGIALDSLDSSWGTWPLQVLRPRQGMRWFMSSSTRHSVPRETWCLHGRCVLQIDILCNLGEGMVRQSTGSVSTWSWSGGM